MLGEEEDGFFEGVDEHVEFFWGIVKLEAGAGCGGKFEFAHQRLVTMMTASKGHTFLVGETREIVGMDVGVGKAHEGTAFTCRAEGAKAWDSVDSAFGFSGEVRGMLVDSIDADLVEEIDCGMEREGAFDVRGTCFEASGRLFVRRGIVFY